MDEDLEERPSKMRKLDTSDSIEIPLESPKKVVIPSQPLDPTNGETPFQSNESTPLTSTPPLSKSALKKLKRKEAWAASADDRRAKRRDQHRDKQARKAAARDELAAKIAAGEIEAPPVVARPYFRPQQVPVGLVIDCDFEDKMMEKEIISLGSQLTRCYSENKGAKYRVHLCISSWGGVLENRFKTVLSNTHLGWKGVRFEPANFVGASQILHDIMKSPEGGQVRGALKNNTEDSEKGEKVTQEQEKTPPSTKSNGQSLPEPATQAQPETTTSEPTPQEVTPPKIVYLSSDSPDTLQTLSPYTSYIIGGIVDKNRHKGLCYARARELGIPTAKLPIGKYMTMQSRTVLTVNHVVEIMLRWLEVGDWGVAFEKVIPKRKGGVLKEKNGDAQGKRKRPNSKDEEAVVEGMGGYSDEEHGEGEEIIGENGSSKEERQEDKKEDEVENGAEAEKEKPDLEA